MYSGDFSRVLVVLIDYCSAGKVAHGNDVISLIHPVHLDTKDRWVYITPTTVKVGGVYMYDERLPRHLFGVDTRRIGQPVVGVDDIYLFGTCDYTCYDGVVVDLLQKVIGILARELKAAKVIRPTVGEVSIDMIPQMVVHLWAHFARETLSYVLIGYISVDYGGITCTNDTQEARVLIT